MSFVEEWGKRVANPTAQLTVLEEKLLAYINGNPHEAAFMSLKELCDETGVSKPKVIDLYKKLGYENFRAFRESIQRFYAHHIDAYRSSRATFKQITTQEELIAAARESDIRAITRLSEYVTKEDFASISKKIMESRSIYIMGPSTGQYPAHYLYQRLKRYGIDVQFVGHDVQHILEDIINIGDKDFLLVFHYYPDRQTTYNAMQLAKDSGAQVFVVTDTMIVDLAETADRIFFVERGSMGFKNSMAVPMHFVNLLILNIEYFGGPLFRDQLRELEEKRVSYRFKR